MSLFFVRLKAIVCVFCYFFSFFSPLFRKRENKILSKATPQTLSRIVVFQRVALKPNYSLNDNNSSENISREAFVKEMPRQVFFKRLLGLRP
jgi:hypothetical protein